MGSYGDSLVTGNIEVCHLGPTKPDVWTMNFDLNDA